MPLYMVMEFNTTKIKIYKRENGSNLKNMEEVYTDIKAEGKVVVYSKGNTKMILEMELDW